MANLYHQQNKNTINIITMGCPKNRVDSEQLATQLIANGFEVVHESTVNETITMVNTCGFIASAKEESINAVLSCVNAKKKGKIKTLIVFGCLSERYKEDIKKEIPEVDAVFGVNEVPDILSYLHSQVDNALLDKRLISTPKHYAYLKISEGCSHRCSFCAIPYIRGKQISKQIDAIIKEAQLLVNQGIKEIILVAQDLTDYGSDLPNKPKLSALLEQLSLIDNLQWLRLHYAYPNTFDMKILDVIASNSNICKYLDMPIQHINNEILKAMNRKITSDEIVALLDKIKQKIPDIALRTSLIVGFPNETQKHFEELIDFVQAGWFDRLGVFTYSKEENTPAFLLPDNVSQRQKQKRQAQLMDVQYEISLKKNEQKKSQILKVLIDELSDNQYIGRTEFDAPEIDNTVLIETNQKLNVGEFYNVKITNTEAFDLQGVVVK
ncbi:MAG: 30S ribosomal protein S12 methylthiotransferase RimO [Bacteroidales bacterium]|nr:30S ribosomal protein S12 methylthiotransferase RimO [Bacteroidales bacterium]